MRRIAACLAVAVGCGGTQPTPDYEPGTVGVVDDSSTDDIQIAEAPKESFCVDVATIEPAAELPQDRLEPTITNLDGANPEPLPQFLAALADGARHDNDWIPEATQLAPNLWAFLYVRCTDLPVCTSFLVRAVGGDDGYELTKSDLDLEDPVGGMGSIAADSFGVADLNDDGSEELWMIVKVVDEARTYERRYLGAYSVPDVLPLLWTQLGNEPFADTDMCGFELGFHDLDCDQHTDVVIDRTCGSVPCVTGDECSADGARKLTRSRDLHVWKPDAGIYFVSERVRDDTTMRR